MAVSKLLLGSYLTSPNSFVTVKAQSVAIGALHASRLPTTLPNDGRHNSGDRFTDATYDLTEAVEVVDAFRAVD
ncbi:hypothetical protein [Allorhodopirellula heiligendammensis]|uniref:Uncharacterized protein n=1 Tax=Allorhodopirellula heiligendammensis TaxID=2714739 RepID=A0A5C6BE01_9BACT|nr:hypothetical protein [Allorhodopirellula heiligendammensis]TWU10268.1 hypothetical protein Poly21_52390 [Allorhodopirellula heiligendammensis]